MGIKNNGEITRVNYFITPSKTPGYRYKLSTLFPVFDEPGVSNYPLDLLYIHRILASGQPVSP